MLFTELVFASASFTSVSLSKCFGNIKSLQNENCLEIQNTKVSEQFAFYRLETLHTTYIRNNMGQKCEGNCGLWVLNEMIKKYILKI